MTRDEGTSASRRARGPYAELPPVIRSDEMVTTHDVNPVERYGSLGMLGAATLALGAIGMSGIADGDGD